MTVFVVLMMVALKGSVILTVVTMMLMRVRLLMNMTFGDVNGDADHSGQMGMKVMPMITTIEAHCARDIVDDDGNDDGAG